MIQLFQRNSKPKRLNLKEIWRVYRIYTSVSLEGSNAFSRLTPFHIREILSTLYEKKPASTELEVVRSFTDGLDANHFFAFFKAIKGMSNVHD